MYPSIDIAAPSRLHFGLLAFGHSCSTTMNQARRYGGVGLMVDAPGVSISFRSSHDFAVQGPLSERVCRFAQMWRESSQLDVLPTCQIRVCDSVREHVGLGTGTQLGLAVAAGLNALVGRSCSDITQLAASVGRGRRSSVGTYGFQLGGLLFESGKAEGERFGRLDAHLLLPEKWRICLFCPHGQGLSGEREALAFRRLPPVPPETTRMLTAEVVDRMLPAASRGDIEQFGDSVYHYGFAAGMYFASCQAGPFCNTRLAGWVGAMRKRGILGVGQSSWGPTIFALVPDTAAAEELIGWFLRDVERGDDVEVVVARPSRAGARITCMTSS